MFYHSDFKRGSSIVYSVLYVTNTYHFRYTHVYSTVLMTTTFSVYKLPNQTISLLLDVQVVFIFSLSEKNAGMSSLGHSPCADL